MTTEKDDAFDGAVKAIYARIEADASSKEQAILPIASALCELQRAVQLHEMEVPTPRKER